jgi:hypothetical protein
MRVNPQPSKIPELNFAPLAVGNPSDKGVALAVLGDSVLFTQPFTGWAKWWRASGAARGRATQVGDGQFKDWPLQTQMPA